jgi:hypothetical protein
VSSAAADELDMKSEGIAKVRLTLLDEGNPPGDDCGTVASTAVEAGGDLPVDEPTTTLPAAVVTYTESNMDSDIEPGTLTEIATVPDAVDDRMAERFELAFQPESERDPALKRALGAFAPRTLSAPPDVEPTLAEPASSEMLLFSHTSAASWPIFDGQPALDIRGD